MIPLLPYVLLLCRVIAALLFFDILVLSLHNTEEYTAPIYFVGHTGRQQAYFGSTTSYFSVVSSSFIFGQ